MQPQLQVRHSPGPHAAHSLVVETKSFIHSFVFVFIYSFIQTYVPSPNYVFHIDPGSGNITGNMVTFVLLRIGYFSKTHDKPVRHTINKARTVGRVGLPVGKDKAGWRSRRRCRGDVVSC